MKARVRVGDVEMAVTGADLTVKELRGLLRAVASVALAVNQPDDPPEPGPPIGFSAHLERLPDDNWPAADPDDE